ncbi:MAG TPA: ABC transporter substrate-binding protein [Burkholderiaceae bacterium]|jgi:branched-chain amino acid transport system substrate-binding protein|nr:ABC transporter substrate-binding protein [Burkholderiaceae bacterium]
MSARKLASVCLGALAALCAAAVHAQGSKPAELKVGITTFLSGPASVFGVPARAAAEMWIEEFNAAGGIQGVKLAPVFIDEGLGGDKMLSEYRRVAQEAGEKVMLASISSGNCNIVAPVAEDLKVLNIMWDCGTEKILEDRRYKYVFRTQANAVTEMVATVVYLLRVKPDFKTIAVVNQDYAWGRDSWEIFRNTLLALKPDTKVVAELFPKFGAPDYSTEISRLQALRPDVILSTSWGGDLDTLVRQAAQRGLTKTSTFVLPLAESSLERLGVTMPEGAIVGARGDHWFLHPEFRNDPKFKAFVEKFRARTKSYPIYPVYHMVQALQAVATAYDKAIKANKGQWPNTEQVVDAMRGLEFRGLTRPLRIREDGQALEDQLLGVTKKDPAYPFMVLDRMTIIPADLVTTPVGQKSPEWVKTLKPDLLRSDRIKALGG